MPKFRKRPVVIEAVEYTEAVRLQLKGWCPQMILCKDGAIIPTLEGDMVVREGDWIIRGVAGEFYPCKPDIFAATYEPVADAERREPGYMTAEEQAEFQRLKPPTKPWRPAGGPTP